jgi:hypothetical protein
MTRHLSLVPLQSAISPKRRTALAALLKRELHDDNLELIFSPSKSQLLHKSLPHIMPRVLLYPHFALYVSTWNQQSC